MIIRRIDEDDVSCVVEMMLSNWDGVMSKYHSEEIVRKFRDEVTSDWLKRQMAWKQVFVAEKEGKIVATGALADFGNSEAPKLCVSQFFVQPYLHGQGIGKLLMNYLVQIARDGGCSLLHVPSSRNAVSFYASVGFVADAAQPDGDDEITWMSMAI